MYCKPHLHISLYYKKHKMTNRLVCSRLNITRLRIRADFWRKIWSFSGLELARVPRVPGTPQNFWTAMSGTRGFWQFHYILLCFTLKFWRFTSVWYNFIWFEPICSYLISFDPIWIIWSHFEYKREQQTRTDNMTIENFPFPYSNIS